MRSYHRKGNSRVAVKGYDSGGGYISLCVDACMGREFTMPNEKSYAVSEGLVNRAYAAHVAYIDLSEKQQILEMHRK